MKKGEGAETLRSDGAQRAAEQRPGREHAHGMRQVFLKVVVIVECAGRKLREDGDANDERDQPDGDQHLDLRGIRSRPAHTQALRVKREQDQPDPQDQPQ